MTSHNAYEKMAESLAALDIDEGGWRALRRATWVVTEKVHGANFALLGDFAAGSARPTVRAAKRKAVLPPDEDFFGHRALLSRIEPAVLGVFERVRAARPSALRATIYGELFGGSYPHPDVPPCPGVEAVQTGVHYSPRIELSAFDIAVDVPGRGREYLDYDTALDVFHGAGLFCAEPLFVGPYEEAASFSLGFDSTVPARLGLPPLSMPNPAEGVVVKPVKNIVVAARGGPVRPVVKRKIPQFAEDRRFHEAEKWAAPPKGADPLSSLEWEMLALVTENRLDATISKIGRVAPGDASRAREVIALLAGEVWTTLAETQGTALSSVRDEDRALLRSVLEDEAQKLLDAHVAATTGAAR